MAKKWHRILIWLICSTCWKQNFVTEKNKLNTSTKLSLKKHCTQCRKHNVHKEKLKLK